MRLSVLGLVVVAACGTSRPALDAAGPDAPPPDAPSPDAPSPDAPPAGLDPVYQGVYNAVDDDMLMARLTDLAHERFSPAGQQAFRDAWTTYMQGLGLTVTPFDYPAQGGNPAGHDLEAVMPGASADSVVIIVHYDSIGVAGMETANPGADDDMSGMAILLETARVLAPYAGHLKHTVRFVASDQEELGGLAGARAYAAHLRDQAAAQGFAIVAAIDDEQSGWNCHADGLCTDADAWPVFDVFSCDGTGTYNFPALGDQLSTVVAETNALGVQRGCIGANSDHYAFWEIGVPAVVFTEHDPFANPHFDQNGGDTIDKIDRGYFTSIARPSIAFAATVIGITP
jgi:hypothetical protein